MTNQKAKNSLLQTCNLSGAAIVPLTAISALTRSSNDGRRILGLRKRGKSGVGATVEVEEGRDIFPRCWIYWLPIEIGSKELE